MNHPAPLGLIAELTHRCPLKCLYCSNPLELTAKNTELQTAVWQEVIRQSAQIGIHQISLTGGEPCARTDLVEIARTAVAEGLYVNLITSGIGLSDSLLEELAAAGIDHIQLSLQDSDAKGAQWVSGRDA